MHNDRIAAATAAVSAALACGPYADYPAPEVEDLELSDTDATATLVYQDLRLQVQVSRTNQFTSRNVNWRTVDHLIHGRFGDEREPRNTEARWAHLALHAVVDVLDDALAGKEHTPPRHTLDRRHLLAEVHRDVPAGLARHPLDTHALEVADAIPLRLRPVMRLTAITGGDPFRGIPAAALLEVDGVTVTASTRYPAGGGPGRSHVSYGDGRSALIANHAGPWLVNWAAAGPGWAGMDAEVINTLLAVSGAVRVLAENLVGAAFESAQWTTKAVIERVSKAAEPGAGAR